jgi:hypothetical protein
MQDHGREITLGEFHKKFKENHLDISQTRESGLQKQSLISDRLDSSYTEDERGRAWALAIVGQGISIECAESVQEAVVDGDRFTVLFKVDLGKVDILRRMLKQGNAVAIYSIDSKGKRTRIRKPIADAARHTGSFNYDLYNARALLVRCIDSGFDSLIGATVNSHFETSNGMISYSLDQRLAKYLDLLLNYLESAIQIESA